MPESRGVHCDGERFDMWMEIIRRQPSLLRADDNPTDYTKEELRDLLRTLPAEAEKPIRSWEEIHVDGECFASFRDRKTGMVWDEEKQGWWVNKSKWLPASTPFEIEQHPIE